MATQQTETPTLSRKEAQAARKAQAPTSVWQLYGERFNKHTLGRVGLAILLVLYGISLFAGFLSPATMTWTDKLKPYHPPTRINLFERTEEGTRFRPFVYEQTQVNIAFREYGIVPERSLRLIVIPDISTIPDFREISWHENPQQRVGEIMREYERRFRLDPDSAASTAVRTTLETLAAGQGEEHERIRIEIPVSNGDPVGYTVWMVRGNKNYLRVLGRNVSYRFWNLFTAQRRLITSPTGAFFLLGTDHLGRDILSRLIYGSRISLTVGLLGVAISFTIGVLVGGVAGYVGGRLDSALMRVVEVMQSIPTIYLLFALRAAFPANLSSTQVYLLIVVILSLTAWSSLARIIRGMVLAIKSEEYVLAARSLGLGHLAIIVRHILPNTMSLIIVQASLTVPGYILGESALSLLGLGITEPQSSWGLMLAVARNFRVMSQFPWVMIPGVLIFIAILAWNFFGDGIRDAMDPKSVIR